MRRLLRLARRRRVVRGLVGRRQGDVRAHGDEGPPGARVLCEALVAEPLENELGIVTVPAHPVEHNPSPDNNTILKKFICMSSKQSVR